MAATHLDQSFLAAEQTFQNRVGAALLQACVSIYNEGWAVPFHRERAQFAAQVIANTNSTVSYKAMFAAVVATDPTVIADATSGGTVPIDVNNAAAKQALVTDAHIDAAIASQFNAFFRTPS